MCGYNIIRCIKLLPIHVLLGVLILVGSVFAAGNGVAKKPSLSNIGIGANMDKRIRKIVKNPKVLDKLDQRRSFKSQESYHDVLNRGLKEVRVILPQLFSDSFKSNASVAVNMSEERIFFRLEQEDKEIVGWMPLHTSVPNDSLKTSELVLWIIPHVDKNTSLSRVWSQKELKKVDTDTWVKSVVKMTLGVDLRMSSGEEMRKDIKARRFRLVGKNVDSETGIVVSDGVVQVSVNMAKAKQSLGPGKPTVDEPLNLEVPSGHVSWSDDE